MSKSVLSLEVSPVLNSKVIRIFDTSHYQAGEVIDNYLIEVLPANKSAWLTFNVAKRFSLVLNSSNLRYKKVTDIDDLIDLPDGIYEIKQSYKPNIQTHVHFYHLRTVDLEKKLSVEMNKLIDDRCKISRPEYFINRDKLRDIDEYIKAAKWMVEEEHDKSKGLELYEFTKKLLQQYTNECQC